MKIEYKQNFDHIVNELSKVTNLFEMIDLSSSSKDGRDTAKSGEDIIKDEIKKLTLPYSMNEELDLKPRNWYDYKLGDIPVNIKITTGEHPDNAGSKLGVYVACTGYFPVSDPKMPNFCKMLREGIDNPAHNIDDVDYVFLVFNRKTKHIHWIGLRQLTVLQPNGRNPPFQIDWSKNIEPVERDLKSARKLLLFTYFESARKASETVILFEENFAEFLEE